jgi:putative hydrolase of the HAD superfamily
LQKNYKLGVVTDGYLPAQEYKIQALGIQKYFGSIIYTEKIGREFWKPSPRGFEKLLKEMEIAPKQAVYVADNYEKDFIAPNKMGFQTIRIMRPNGIHTSPAASEDAMAKYEINSLTQLPALLKKINVL